MRPMLESRQEQYERGPRLGGSGASSGSVVLIVITLAAVAITAGLLGWKAGVWGPDPAEAKPKPEVRAPVRPPSQSADAALAAAARYVQQGNVGLAEGILRDAVGQNVEHQELRLRLAEALMQQKKYADSYEQYVAALAIGPRVHEAEFAAGTMASLSGQHERAREHYAAAQALESSNPKYALYLAQTQLKLGENEAAKANLLMAANLKPDDPQAWGMLADIALRENNVAIAIQHIAKARELQPNYGAWRLIEARAQKRNGDPQAALIILLGMDAAERQDPAVLRLIAECYGMIERPHDAAETYAKASDAKKDDADLAYEAATWYARADRNDQAMVYARRAFALGHAQAPKLIERLGN